MPTFFIRLQSKMTLEIHCEARSLDGKWLRMAQDALVCLFFFLEKQLLLRKKKHFSIFHYQIRNAYKFRAFMIKNDFENLSQSGEFRFENSLNFCMR